MTITHHTYNSTRHETINYTLDTSRTGHVFSRFGDQSVSPSMHSLRPATVVGVRETATMECMDVLLPIFCCTYILGACGEIWLTKAINYLFDAKV